VKLFHPAALRAFEHYEYSLLMEHRDEKENQNRAYVLEGIQKEIDVIRQYIAGASSKLGAPEPNTARPSHNFTVNTSQAKEEMNDGQ